MKLLLQTPAQPGQLHLFGSGSGPPPLWAELPLARQQELIRILSSLLLRHWPHPPQPPQEVTDEPQL
jgi:hypothetical protein